MVAGSGSRATAGWDLHEVRDADACGAAGFGAGSAAGLGRACPGGQSRSANRRWGRFAGDETGNRTGWDPPEALAGRTSRCGEIAAPWLWPVSFGPLSFGPVSFQALSIGPLSANAMPAGPARHKMPGGPARDKPRTNTAAAARTACRLAICPLRSLSVTGTS